MEKPLSDFLLKKLRNMKKCRRDELLRDLLILFRRANLEEINQSAADKNDTAADKRAKYTKEIGVGWIAVGACAFAHWANSISWWF